MYKVLKNESDFDDWIRVLPDEVSVVSTQTAVKNSLKEVLQRFDELVDTDGEYIGLRTIHPLFAGQRFSGKWEFRNFVFPEEK